MIILVLAQLPFASHRRDRNLEAHDSSEQAIYIFFWSVCQGPRLRPFSLMLTGGKLAPVIDLLAILPNMEDRRML